MTTIDTGTRLADLVTAHPRLARELERRGLDFCCGGDQTMDEACRAAGLDPATVAAELAAVTAAADDERAPWATMGPAELVDHIVDTHHRFLWEELPRAEALVQRHRQQGDLLMVITSTNRFIVEPICRRLGIGELLATELEVDQGRYTGKVAGTPTYREGKVARLREWLDSRDDTLAGSYFYSDSINDLPLLEEVDNPVAVDPDEPLAAIAAERGWPVISLRG